MFSFGGGFWTYFLKIIREVVLGSCGRFTSCSACSVLVFLVTIRPVLCSFVCRLVVPRSSSTSAAVCALVLLVLMHVALCGVWGFSCLAAWRSVHSRCFVCVDCPSSSLLESGHYFFSPFMLIVTWPLFQYCMRRVRDGSVHRHWPM